MKIIPLTRSKVAIVDDEDYDWLAKHSWCAIRPNGIFYAMRGFHSNGKNVSVYMHRQIMNAKSGVQIDHINRNSLDNRKSNLRFADQTQNNANSGMNSRNTSGFKGVCWNKDRRKWVATISRNNKTVYLGLFKNPEDAASAYDAAAVSLRGHFARTNKVMGLLQ